MDAHERMEQGRDEVKIKGFRDGECQGSTEGLKVISDVVKPHLSLQSSLQVDPR